VEVASIIVRALGASLDVLIVRKLGVPGYKDFPIGAVSIGGARFINLDVVEGFHSPNKKLRRSQH
jgi:putative phosphoribosyl transferase